MPYRLKVDLEGRLLRFPLAAGTHQIGASPSCSVRIPHSSVSRRHAEIVVGEGGARLRDTGSTNGTSVGFAKITGEVALEPGARCAFGSVEAWLEEVPAGDLEAGIDLGLPETPPRPEAPPRAAATTARLTKLEAFALQQLPALVERLVDAAPEESLQLVGGALCHSLPAERVEIVRRRGEAEGVLFAGGGEGGEASGAAAPALLAMAITADMTLRLAFSDPAAAETYEPLARTSAALLRLAMGRAAPPAPPAPPARRAATPPPLPDPPTVVPALKRLYEKAWRVADGNVSVLIRGESGTGKEILARYVHAASPRAEARLVTLNCAALPRDLLESELFGVEKGAATGVSARPGKFELAHESTLFLDEIGDMALETQAKILRVLQEHEVYRLGGNEPRPADVRVLAATNRDLETMLDEGSFRRDLYHRIADWVVELPPLRRRKADIPNLAAWFLSRECREKGHYVAGVSRAAVDALLRYAWPGNVRELEKEMARAVLFLEDGALLETEHLRPEIVAAHGDSVDEGLKEILEDYERRVIARALSDAGGDTVQAADDLKIARSTLYRRLKALGIEP
jgi:transcriptional regulator of acetoin/glycerol metabolism